MSCLDVPLGLGLVGFGVGSFLGFAVFVAVCWAIEKAQGRHG